MGYLDTICGRFHSIDTSFICTLSLRSITVVTFSMGNCLGKNKEETEPLIQKGNPKKKGSEKKTTKSTALEFARLEVQEFDSVFTDFARALNPFVTDRQKLEQAVAKFKTAVESLQAVRPHASFREYAIALKTKLKDEGIFIKIKNGAVQVYGVAGRTIKAVEDAISAIMTIVAAGEALKDMPEVVTTASGSSLRDAESSMENLQHIIRREFSGIFDICKVVRFKRNLKSNIKNLKNAPNMVKDFCQEVKTIIEDIGEVLNDETDDDDDDEGKNNENDGKVTGEVMDEKRQEENAQSRSNVAKIPEEKEGRTEREDGNENDASGKSSSNDQEKKKIEGNDKKSKKEKKKEKKKEDYHKQLKMETVGLADIDKIFTHLMTSLNKFVTTREKMQQARESFEKVMKTISNFDGEKEFKAYLKELKEKAKEGKIQIYIDTNNGEIKLDSVKGVDPPAPYRNAVKALNDIKASANETLDLEPDVERGIESCARDITKIEPMKDFKKLVSGVKETMALPKKVKAFNENRKKVQQAPQIVKEFCLYVKQVIEDIVNAFKDEDKAKAEEKDENTAETEDAEDNADAVNGNAKEKSVEALIQAPGKPQKSENVEENNTSTVIC